MGDFEENLQNFSNTIYGSEMRDSLCNCLGIIKSIIDSYTKSIQEANSKINELEGGG